MAPYDVDGDGDVDLAIASEFSLGDSNNGGLIHWVESPDDPTTNQEWALHPIDAVPASHRIRWGDIDGDGRKELLNLPIIGIGVTGPEYVGASRFRAYRIPDDPKGAWEQQVLDDSRLEVAHGISVVDWDGDRAEDILSASNAGVFLFQPALGGQPRHMGPALTRRVRIVGRARSASALWAASASSPRSSRGTAPTPLSTQRATRREASGSAR